MQHEPVILVTGFLGVPETSQTSLRDSVIRFRSTLAALTELRDRASCTIYVAVTGSSEAAEELRRAVRLPPENLAWFPQRAELFEYGKGRLEVDLIRKAIRHWQLFERKRPVISSL